MVDELQDVYHSDSVQDTDAYFVINDVTRAISTNRGTDVTLIQFDHNSERFTFKLPRYIDGHDMSECNKVEVHYINIGIGGLNKNKGMYAALDLHIDPDDEDFVLCSWIVSQNATQLAGTLNFLVHYACMDGEKVEYSWHTGIYKGVKVGEGINNTAEIVDQYVDILEQWKLDLINTGSISITNINAARDAALNRIDEAEEKFNLTYNSAMIDIADAKQEISEAKEDAVSSVGDAKESAVREIEETEQEFVSKKNDSLSELAQAKISALNGIDEAEREFVSIKESALDEIDKAQDDLISVKNAVIDEAVTAKQDMSTTKDNALASINSGRDSAIDSIGEAEQNALKDINSAMLENVGNGVSVKKYGAKGDGSTDDTAAFQSALAENRVVGVPGGTYVISDALVIGANCRLELSQSTVLKFKQTSGNCIEMRSSATLNGNHATIEVPYAFSGKVVCVDTAVDEARDTPPYLHWDPMWKRARYIYDVCIVKPDPTHGLHYSMDGTCSGTAIYMSCDGEAPVGFIWGAMLQGIRIAGAFTYGIHVINFDDPNDGTEDDAWNHDMRIEAVLQGCEVGVSLTNCNNAHLAVTVQPSTANNDTKYAKWGVYLNDCRNTDMSSACVWDWHAARDDSPEYKHIAMYGNCRGLVLSDMLYHEQSVDIRNTIYTDTPSNLEKMVVLQEPITRWFRPIEGSPYFNDGQTNKKLITQEELDEHFDTDMVKGFTDALATATDVDGNIYNGIGYKTNTGYYDSSWSSFTNATYYANTGFIPVKAGDVVYGKNFTPSKNYDGNCRIVCFDASKTKYDQASVHNLATIGDLYAYKYEETDDGFKLTIKDVDSAGWPCNTEMAYIRLQVHKTALGENPMISVNEEIKYTYAGFLADGIQVKGENVLLTSPSGKSFKLSVTEDGVLTTSVL